MWKCLNQKSRTCFLEPLNVSFCASSSFRLISFKNVQLLATSFRQSLFLCSSILVVANEKMMTDLIPFSGKTFLSVTLNSKTRLRGVLKNVRSYTHHLQRYAHPSTETGLNQIHKSSDKLSLFIPS